MPAKAGIQYSEAVRFIQPVITGSSAFADDDSRSAFF